MNEECRPCRIKEFFSRPHTPLETGLIAAAGVLTGVIIGIAISPVMGGIEVSIGSHNGSHNDCCK